MNQKQRRPEGRIDEEEVSKDCFLDYLKQVCGYSDISAERVEQKDQPPDYWIAVQGKTFAVEVTSITVESSVRYYEQCKEFKSSIEAKARDSGLLSGTYVLSVQRQPGMPKVSSQEWEQLAESAMNYMKTTCKSEQDIGGIYLANGRDGSIQISKAEAKGSFVALAGPVSSLVAGQGIHADMAELIQNAIVRKREKLLTKDPDILKHCSGVVLLLYDAYGPSEVKHARSAFETVRDYEWFHTIFVASPLWHELGMPTVGEWKRREGQILFTKEPAWLGTDKIVKEAGA